MNERIEELMDKAMVKSANMSSPNRKELDPEKFAELIVQECVSTLETKIDEGEGYGSYENGAYHGLIRARNIIKKHFGVE